jgi:S1-C subfamily serine protease
VIHIEFQHKGNRVGSGSGFLSNGYLVTNCHVYLGPEYSEVILACQPSQDPSSRVQLEMSYKDFSDSLVSASDENNFDFAILKIEELNKQGFGQLEMAVPTDSKIGDGVMILGFPLEHRNLVCHMGTISSFYKSGRVNVIQLDAQRKPGTDHV